MAEFSSHELKKEEDDQIDPVEENDSSSNIRTFLWLIVILITSVFLILSIRYFYTSNIIEIPHPVSGNPIKISVQDSYEYKGYTFNYADDLWYVTIFSGNTELIVPLHYGPRDLLDIPLTGYVDNNFTTPDKIYVAFDPTATPRNYTALAMGEISLSLARALGQNIESACTKNLTIDIDGRQDRSCLIAPKVTCEDKDKAVIEIIPGKKPKVSLLGNCIKVQGEGEDLLRAADRMLLKWYKVMD
jgi:hypothetical protein